MSEEDTTAWNRMTEALWILRRHNPIHNDFEEYLYDIASWGLGELDEQPEPAKYGIKLASGDER